MSEQEQQEASEGIVGQSASTAGLARRIVFHWNQAVKDTGDGTYPIIIAKFAERIAFDEREACATVCESLVVGRPDDHAANYFDGGCRTCAGEIRKRSNAALRGGEAVPLEITVMQQEAAK